MASRKLPATLKTALNRYSPRGVIGEGASGFVVKVESESGELFAAKLLDPRLTTSERRRRFENELNFLFRNVHRNIVRVLDFGSVRRGSRDAPFYVMPLYKTTLRGVMKTDIVPQEVMRYFGQILDGVEAAHLKGVVHRDLKPENVLVDSDASGLVLADFGIAHFTEEDLHTLVETKPTTRLANFQYAAPEQRARGGKVDPQADLFALGLILNELFTGQIPQGTGFVTIGSRVADYGYLDDIVGRLIRQDPAERHGSIDELKKDLLSARTAFVSRQKLDALRDIDPPPFSWTRG